MSRLYEKMAYYAERYPKNKAFTYRVLEQYEFIDYATLLRYVDSLSACLEAFHNKTIAIIGNNKLEYAVSLLAILCSEQTAFLIDKELRPDEIEKIFEKKKPDLIILDDDLGFSFEKYLVYYFSDIKKMMREGHEVSRDTAHAGNLILHTSGTTGEPKLVFLTEEKYYVVIPELNQKWGVRPEHSCLLIIPLYHVYALTSLFHGIYAGINNILEWDYKRINVVLAETKPHLFMGVPLMYHRIMDIALEKAGKKLSTAIFLSNFLLLFGIDIRKKWFHEIHEYFGGNYVFGVSAGSPLSGRTRDFFRDVGLPIYNVYGMTETAGPIAINYEHHDRKDSVGEILKVNEVKIEDPDEKGIGHVRVKGSNVFDGYLAREIDADSKGNCGKENGESFDGQYFDTGDLGYVKDGYLYIVGRENGILIGANGKNISAEELRRKVMESQGIYGCKVVMEKDKLVAIVNTDLDGKELEKCLERLNQKLPRYKRISEIRTTDERLK